MDWFSILKNQVASTKGKQFQLDFSQPMVEEDDSCKQKLLDLVKRLASFSKEDYETSIWAGSDSVLSLVSEEECCRVINFFKVIKDGEGNWSSNYRLGAWKNNYRDYRGVDDNLGHYYINAISIAPHYDAALRRSIPIDATNEEIEKIGREFKEVSDRLFVL